MSKIDFLNPEYYDVKDIHPDCPNKPLIEELFEAMNAQNERLWMFFTEMTENPEWKPMSAMSIKPRQHRPKHKKYMERKAAIEKSRTLRPFKEMNEEEEESGYKDFLKEEGFDDLL